MYTQCGRCYRRVCNSSALSTCSSTCVIVVDQYQSHSRKPHTHTHTHTHTRARALSFGRTNIITLSICLCVSIRPVSQTVICGFCGMIYLQLSTNWLDFGIDSDQYKHTNWENCGLMFMTCFGRVTNERRFELRVLCSCLVWDVNQLGVFINVINATAISSKQSTVIWATNHLSDRRLGDKTFGRHTCDKTKCYIYLKCWFWLINFPYLISIVTSQRVLTGTLYH